MRADTPMVIDCQTCPVRNVRCDDCIVTALGPAPARPLLELGVRAVSSEEDLPLDAAERRAVGIFVRAGLVSPEHAATVTSRRERHPGVRAVG
ncbi:MAG: hypothetical protein M3Y71_07685 [Actinomycetota bacterium]|nr:hypothetical protein [Actinomycetota bacterium]